MSAARFGRLLLALGLLVGCAASVGLLVGFEPARLPASLINVAAYKLTFIAALGLLAAGAVSLRHARRAATRSVGPATPRHSERRRGSDEAPSGPQARVRQPEGGA